MKVPNLFLLGVLLLSSVLQPTLQIQAQETEHPCLTEYKQALQQAQENYDRDLQRADTFQKLWDELHHPLAIENRKKAISQAHADHSTEIIAAQEVKDLRYELAQGEFDSGLITEEEKGNREQRADLLYKQQEIIADTLLARAVEKAWDTYDAIVKNVEDTIRKIRQNALPKRYAAERRARIRYYKCQELNGGAQG